MSLPPYRMPTRAEWSVLRFIVKWPETPPTQISQDLFRTPSHCSSLCQSLAIKGLIKYKGQIQHPVATEDGLALVQEFPEDPSKPQPRNLDPRCQHPDDCLKPGRRRALCNNCYLDWIKQVNREREQAALKFIARKPFSPAKVIAKEIGGTYTQGRCAVQSLREQGLVSGCFPTITPKGIKALGIEGGKE